MKTSPDVAAAVQGSRAADLPPTIGVEEEFVLLRPDGKVACVAADVLRSLDGAPNVKPEFMRFQVETTTGICPDLFTVAADLVRQRRLVARAAEEHGVHLVSSATPPFDFPGAVAITDKPRYHLLQERFSSIAGLEVSSGCHVHVEVASRDLGVAVLNQIRGWLPVLLAVSVNSPLWRDRDSGWASYRFLVQKTWPTAIIPPRFVDAARYDEAVNERIAVGDALDPASIYFFARLSPHLPTVEIRIADTCLDVGDAVLLAGLCRALVMTATAGDHPDVDVPDSVLAASTAAAAREGLDAMLVDPRTARLLPGRAIVDSLLRHITPALNRAGDGPLIATLLSRRLRRGSGADRQRMLRRQLGREGFVRAMAADTLAVDRPEQTRAS